MMTISGIAMKRIFSYTCVPALLMPLLVGCHTVKSVVPQKERSIVVLFDNDVHCGIQGYQKVAGLRDAISDTAFVSIVSCGDYIQGGTVGAISHGQYIMDIMKHVGYDAVTLGNHEFDYSVPRMKELLSQLNAPVVCVNLFDMQRNRLYAPYTIKSFGKKKVAYIGVVTPTSLYTEEYAFFDEKEKQIYELGEKKVYQLVQNAVDEVRKQGVDYVIVLSHLGETPNVLNADSHGLIANTSGIDVVLDGHTHSVIPTETVMDKEGRPVIISQTGAKFANVGKLVIMPDGKKSTQLVPVGEITFENVEVKHATDSILSLSNSLTSRIICRSDVDLRILDDEGYQEVRRSETNAGDIVTDAFRVMTGADFAITNGGGIRNEVKAGQLTYGDVVALLPYDNYVMVVDITGQELVDLLAACTQFIPVENGDFPQVSGIKFTINSSEKDLSKRILDLTVLNKQTGDYEPVDLQKTYSLATIDYCVKGGGLQGKLKKNKVIRQAIMIYNECLIKYITEHINSHIGKEYAEPQGRIKILK